MRILIADDSALVRRGVIAILASNPSWEICGEAQNGIEAIQKARELLPDLILLDVSMPGLNGLDAAYRLRQEVSTSKIIVMSQYDPLNLGPRVAEAGAHGCLDKSRLAMDLVPAIEKLA